MNFSQEKKILKMGTLLTLTIVFCIVSALETRLSSSIQATVVLLPQSPECVDYRHILPYLAYYDIFFNYHDYPVVPVFNFRKRSSELKAT